MKWTGCPLCTRVFRRSISTQILAAGDWVLVQYQNLSKYKNNISVVLQRCDASHCIMNTNCVSLAALPTSFSLVFNGPFQSSPPRHLSPPPRRSPCVTLAVMWFWLEPPPTCRPSTRSRPLQLHVPLLTLYLCPCFFSSLSLSFSLLIMSLSACCVSVWKHQDLLDWDGLQRPWVDLSAHCRL